MTVAKELHDFKLGCPSGIELNRNEVAGFLKKSLELIYPQMLRSRLSTLVQIEDALADMNSTLAKIFVDINLPNEQASKLIKSFNDELVKLAKLTKQDAKAILDGDPAALSVEEVLLCYPGMMAIATYRISHFFFLNDVPVLPRLLGEIAHEKTGIDIHPGAKIGDSFLIDHGTGVVIGETATIGNNVKIYQGVTLGALSVEKSLAKKKRHPTIEDDCVIYAHATILGGQTVIGKGSIVGGNVWITKSIPANSLVYHKSEVRLDSLNSFDQIEGLTYEI